MFCLFRSLEYSKYSSNHTREPEVSKVRGYQTQKKKD